VFDVMHYDDFGRFKRRILPFIRWEPLSILQPVDDKCRTSSESRPPPRKGP
jgi:hypothetical protein